MENNNRELSEAINVIAKQIANALRYSDSGYDRTFISVIINANENGTYTVIDEYGIERNCVCSIPNLTLSKGDRVYATVPKGDLSKLYISGVHPQIIDR